MTPRHALLGLAVLVLAGLAALLVEGWVVTDEEAIRDLVQGAGDAVVADDPGALLAALTPDFEALGRDGQGAVDHVMRLWRQNGRLRLESEVVDLVVEGDAARGAVEVRPGFLGRGRRILLDAEFRRTPAGWRIAGAKHVR